MANETITRDSIMEKLKIELKTISDSVTIGDVYPALLENILNLDIEIVGGRDLDYWGKFDKYNFSGSAYYGTCSFYLNEELFDDDYDEDEDEDIECDKETNEDDVYTRIDFELNGYPQTASEPVIQCSDEERDAAFEEGLLNKYYVAFNFHGETVKLVLFYAKKEIDARMRAFSIWGRDWSDIFDETKYLEKINFYNRIGVNYIKPSETYVLNWK